MNQQIQPSASIFIDFKTKKPKSLFQLQGSKLISKYKKQKTTTEYQMPITAIPYSSSIYLFKIVDTYDFSKLDWEYLEEIGNRLYKLFKEAKRVHLNSANYYSEERRVKFEDEYLELKSYFELFCKKFFFEYNYDFEQYVEKYSNPFEYAY